MAKTDTNEKKEMDVSLTVKLPSKLRDRAREKSENTGISLSFVVRKALEDWVRDTNQTADSAT